MARTVSLCVEEGQEVWFSSRVRYIDSGYATVTSVGRLWAILDNGFRANRYTGECDGRGFPSPGFIYLSKEAYEAEYALYASWGSLRKAIAIMDDLPEGITRRDILRIRRLLKVDDNAKNT